MEGKRSCIFLEGKKKLTWAPLKFPASTVIQEAHEERTESDWCRAGQLVKSWIAPIQAQPFKCLITSKDPNTYLTAGSLFKVKCDHIKDT